MSEIINPSTDIPVLPGAPKAAEQAFTIGLDPLTAAFNAAAAFFNFLSTTQGQEICKDIIELDEFFIKKCQEIFTKIHDRIQKG